MYSEYWYIGLRSNGNAIFFNNIEDVDGLDLVSYFHPTEPLPEGKGTIRTDGVSKIWLEDPIPTAEPIINEAPSEVNQMTLIQAQIQALSDQNDFLEDCIAEMAGEIYA